MGCEVVRRAQQGYFAEGALSLSNTQVSIRGQWDRDT